MASFFSHEINSRGYRARRLISGVFWIRRREREGGERPNPKATSAARCRTWQVMERPLEVCKVAPEDLSGARAFARLFRKVIPDFALAGRPSDTAANGRGATTLSR
jgi:hypothetical protein